MMTVIKLINWISVDASAAGSGNLEIMINGGRVACKVRELGGRLYLAAFAPAQPITHVIEMRFNGDPVRGSPWRIEFMHGSSSAMVSSQQQQQAAYVLAPLNAMPGGVFSPYDSASAIQSTTMTCVFRGLRRTSRCEFHLCVCFAVSKERRAKRRTRRSLASACSERALAKSPTSTWAAKDCAAATSK